MDPIRTNGRADRYETLADYRAAQQLAYIQRNIRQISRARWAEKAATCRP